MDANFKFHPVGQGCFYTGRLSLYYDPRLQFNFVYDCGTDSKMIYLENEIDSYKQTLNQNPIDLLIISHFHDDHMNGVFRLLTGVHCRRVIIPYYEPIERLQLFISTTSTDNDYFNFLQNPINFLNNPDRFNIDEIIIIGGPGQSEIENDFNPDKNGPKENDTLEDLYNKFRDLKDFPFGTNLANLEEDSATLELFKEFEPEDTNFDNVKYLSKPHKIDIVFWEFVFYLNKYDENILIQKFTNDVDNILSSKEIVIFDLFKSKYKKELKKLYKLYFDKNLNYTSLVTFHGPLFNTKKNHFHFCNQNRFICDNSKNFGSLLTGDIDLEDTFKINRMRNYFGGKFNEICIFQIPHHGSNHNWCFDNPNGLEQFCVYVINHGLNRKKHPSLEVVDYIDTHCQGYLILNNEANDYWYGFIF